MILLVWLACSTAADRPAAEEQVEQEPTTERSPGTRPGRKASKLRTEPIEVTFEGRRRGGRIHVPASVGPSQKLPVVVMHHGGRGAGAARAVRLWRDQFEQGVVLLFPDGQTRNPSKAGWIPLNDRVDYHVDFVHQLLDHAIASHPIDPDQVFVAGWSNGAQQAMRLACLTPERFRAFSIVSQALEADTLEACKKATPARPIQFILGDADPKNPLDGRESANSAGRLGVRPTIDRFAKRNGCPGATTTVPLPDGPEDQTRVVEHTFTDCQQSLRWLFIEGGGHGWPGGTGGGSDQCQDIDAADESMAFFRSHGLTPPL